MKKFFEKFSYIGCMLPFLAISFAPVFLVFVGIWKAGSGNIGYFIINVLAIPFFFIGAINLIRGACGLVEKDEERFGFKSYFDFAIYLVATIIGYVAVFLAIVQYIKWNR